MKITEMTSLGQLANFEYGLHVRYWQAINMKFPEFNNNASVM